VAGRRRRSRAAAALPPQPAHGGWASKLKVLLPIAAVIGLGLVFLTSDPPKQLRPVSGAKPVAYFQLPGYDAFHPGLANHDLKRGTVTVVNVFASWCKPCIAEVPQLTKLSRDRIVVHGIAVRDDPKALFAFFQNIGGNPYRRLGMDVSGDTARKLGVSALPETLVFDGTGVVRWRQRGELTPAAMESLRKAVAAAGQ
jgi:cytochrome c biogenesis protein CcmG/thiol:disulfide interchange protein DsbE